MPSEIRLVTTKEQLDPSRGRAAIAIVLDVIFATSSISAALAAGARSVIPALDLADALNLASQRPPATWLISGELNARAFDGYRSYRPLAVSAPGLEGKDLIYATTNGTVALRRAERFQRVYTACLRDGAAVARHVWAHAGGDQDLILVCAGSRTRFSLEDFYGAGHLVACLRRAAGDRAPQFSDAALAAARMFEDSDPYDTLREGRLGRLLLSRGLQEDLRYVAKVDACNTVGVLRDGLIVPEPG